MLVDSFVMKYDPAIKIAEDREVYPPSEDSVMLIQSFDVDADESLLEIGCGSGVVAIHCARDGADVTCGDINPKAVELTRMNADEQRQGRCIEKTFSRTYQEDSIHRFNGHTCQSKKGNSLKRGLVGWMEWGLCPSSLEKPPIISI